ncbi:MAG: single-stranded-DNA-specific exonuclease RecJ [Gammaproteobacteria bacterium]|nr:single-stranded-DNA-specific exonuclease RecJ [Gammaproteobacteria bacterium]
MGSGLPETLHPILRRVYANRHLHHENELERDLGRLVPASELGQVEEGAQLLHKVLMEQGRILVVADFDADGATSCALLIRGLRAMGATRVGYLVPNRFTYGYGLTPEIVQEAAKRQPDLIITVDNGISSIQGVDAANALGIPVLVTDHHLPGAVLPKADVIINPNSPGDSFPSKNLAGVGVVFYLLAAVRVYLRECSWFTQHSLQEPNLAELLDLVALGTVADVVPLDQNNRILVHQGLARIRAGRCCEGIKALVAISGRTLHRLVSSDLGFSVGPRLNAAGRLDDMSLGIECLLTDDPKKAMDLARSLDRLNQERRQIEGEMQQQALEFLQALTFDTLPMGLSLFQPEWHQGVIGILASRIKERYHRPVIAFAQADNGTIKGSARSIKGLHIRDLLDRIAVKHPEMLQKFGGHAMAAGLTLNQDDFVQFSTCFNQEVLTLIGADGLDDVIRSDGELTADGFTLEMAELIRAAGPWGQEFEEPHFDGEFRVVEQRIVGEKHLKMTLGAAHGIEIGAIAFNQAEHYPVTETIHAAYRLDSNEYRGVCTPQLVVDYFESSHY